MSDIKKIENPGKFLRDTGLLFEINRTLLHPLGLALEIVRDEDGHETIGGIWDYREDPEGMLYEKETFLSGSTKYAEFMDAFGNEKYQQRMNEIGYVIQNLADPYYVKHGIELWTYNPAYLAEQQEQEETDTPKGLLFSVPEPWLQHHVKDHFEMDVEEFLKWYEFDHAELIYEIAQKQDAIIKESTQDI